MALIAFAADKGAPGVTTSVVALGLSWPRPVLVAECDVAGADLPWWLAGQDGRPLSQSLGIASLATAARSHTQTHTQTVPLAGHVQVVDGGLGVLVGPAGPEQSEAIGASWVHVATCLAAAHDPTTTATMATGLAAGTAFDTGANAGPGAGVDVLADCGRILTPSPLVGPVLQQADLVVMVTRPTLAGVAHLRQGIARIARFLNVTPTAARTPGAPGHAPWPAGTGGPGSAGGGRSGLERIAVLVVGDATTGRRAGARQVEEVLAGTAGLADVPVLGVLAHDAQAAAALAGAGWGARLAKSALLRSARPAAASILDRATTDQPDQPDQHGTRTRLGAVATSTTGTDHTAVNAHPAGDLDLPVLNGRVTP